MPCAVHNIKNLTNETTSINFSHPIDWNTGMPEQKKYNFYYRENSGQNSGKGGLHQANKRNL